MIGESILQLHEGNAVGESINMMNINRLLAHSLIVLDRSQ